MAKSLRFTQRNGARLGGNLTPLRNRANLCGKPGAFRHSIKGVPMLTSLLRSQLTRMQQSLRRRGLWPIPCSEGYDLTDPEVRAELFSLRQVTWPIIIPPQWSTNRISSANWDDMEVDAIRKYLNIGNEFELNSGLARPSSLWIIRISGGHIHRPIPEVRVCTRLEYLELEEVIAQIEKFGRISPE
jgi:hypothetical protein